MYSRTDGEFTIYAIQHQQADLQWKYSSFDHFGTPPKTTDDFSACGECWQKTGHKGVFDFNAAIDGLKWIQDKHRSEKFRLVTIRLRQYTTEVAGDESKSCNRCDHYSPYGSDEMGQCLNPRVIGSSAANRLRGAGISEGFTGGVHPEGFDVEGVCFHKDFGCRHFLRSK